jgi:hypothetical protein
MLFTLIMQHTVEFCQGLLYNLVKDFLYFEGTECCFCGNNVLDTPGGSCFGCESLSNGYKNYEAKYLAFYEQTRSYYKLPTTLDIWWNLYGKEQVLTMRKKMYAPPTPHAPKRTRGCCPSTP